MAAQDNSRLWVLVPSGDRPGPTEPAGETLASLVLINRLAHVRGPVPGLSMRAHGSSLSLVLINRLAHVRAGGFAEAFSAF